MNIYQKKKSIRLDFIDERNDKNNLHNTHELKKHSKICVKKQTTLYTLTNKIE